MNQLRTAADTYHDHYRYGCCCELLRLRVVHIYSQSTETDAGIVSVEYKNTTADGGKCINKQVCRNI